MSVAIVIISICILLLTSYFFDVTTRFSKIPSVILLLVVGFLVKQVNVLLELGIPNLFPILPYLGTLGLILIVLEGALDLELNKSKMKVITRTSILALLPMVLMAIGFALYIHYEWGFRIKDSLVNMVPFAVISSAIAIPSTINLSSKQREFITYESTFSDIFGVVIFNFVSFGTAITLGSAMFFSGQTILMIFISIIASLLLAFLMSKIDHHIKYGPIIIICILIYEIAKVYHLPSLIFILFFGLILGNIEELRFLKIFRKIRFEKLNREVYHFKEVVIEATFIIRSLFFLVFGFVMETDDIFNPDYLVWSAAFVVVIYVLRFIMLKVMKIKTTSFFYIAPRGLVTVLLFLSIADSQKLPIFNQTIVLQVILITTLIMMFGLMFSQEKEGEAEEETEVVNE